MSISREIWKVCDGDMGQIKLNNPHPPIMSKPSSCKYCDNRVECNKSYKRYVHEETEHKCFYETKDDKRKDK